MHLGQHVSPNPDRTRVCAQMATPASIVSIYYPTTASTRLVKMAESARFGILCGSFLRQTMVPVEDRNLDVKIVKAEL